MRATLGLAFAVAAVALAGPVMAQGAAQLDAATIDDWRTVDLGSGVSLDVPKAVGGAYKPTETRDAGLALFRVGVKDAGEMYCGLDKLDYNKPPLGMNRNRALDFLTNAAQGIFCHGVGTGVRENFAQAATSSQGYPGSRCVASYSASQVGGTEAARARAT